MRRNFFIIGLVVFLLLAGALILRSAGSLGSLEGTRVRDVIAPRTAPDFSLADYEGRKVSLADFKGKPLIINMWASWCPFCRRELPDLAAVSRESNGALSVIAINRGEPLETARRYSDSLGTGKEVLFLLDPNDSFYQSIGGFSMPETIFVDRKGNIRSHRRGFMEEEEIRRRIEELL
jgi:thiol-disulfide isomerase/thioredoxin